MGTASETVKAKKWFSRWKERHQRLNPHKEWRSYEGTTRAEQAVVYLGWLAAFDAKGIDEEIADLASVEMQGQGPLYPEHHLAALLRIGGRLAIERQRRRDEAGRQRRRRQTEAMQLEKERGTQLLETAGPGEQDKIRRIVARKYGNAALLPNFFRAACILEFAKANPPIQG
jgi:hypothetical protein